MKRLLKTLTPIIKPIIQRYLSKKRKYNFKGIRIIVYPGIFHPGFFFSTKLLLKFLDSQNLRNVKLLELGAGSGLISIYCSLRKDAIVTASDISSKALINIKENAANNNADIEVIGSDLFDDLDPSAFEMIVINPPYYPKNPKNESENAWFCGSDFQYFKKLFAQLKEKAGKSLVTYMILSEDCQIDKIKSISESNFFKMELAFEEKILGEQNYIFKLQRNEVD